MSDIPEIDESLTEIAGFDFVQECIKTYRMCGDDVEQRIKALTLLKSVQPKKPPVKEATQGTDNRSSVQKAQQGLRTPR